MKLEKIIQELDRKDYTLLVKQLKEKKADKFVILLSGYRKKSNNEDHLLDKLNITPTAYYTLKSRLADKVKEFLYINTHENRIKLLQNVANIEQLVYNTPRETAIGVLKKLEKELVKVDMPCELIIVYRALKKLHIHSPKYFEYSQLYNKSVAFNLGHDKAEELLSSFCKILCEFYLYRNKQLLDILVLYKKEMNNVCKLYKSHYLHVYKNILNIHFALFSPVEAEMKEDETIEKMLKETVSIIQAHPDHQTYKYLNVIIDFLYFEYYFQLKLYKDSSEYYDKLIDKIQVLLLCNHSAFTFHFLISKIEYAVINQKESKLFTEIKLQNYETDINDKSNYILFHYYIASTYFYSKRYPEAIKVLSKLLSEINLIDNAFGEIEIKLFLALLYILDEKKINAESLIRSVNRKITEDDDELKYQCPSTFITLLKHSISPLVKNKNQKIIELNQHFKTINTGFYKVLGFVNLNPGILKQLAEFE